MNLNNYRKWKTLAVTSRPLNLDVSQRQIGNQSANDDVNNQHSRTKSNGISIITIQGVVSIAVVWIRHQRWDFAVSNSFGARSHGWSPFSRFAM